jgi:hypothetical protein
MLTPSPNPFESFNARTLPPSTVAATFVAPESFFRLAKRRHTLVVGPRGSGKTTLMKMLQLGALEVWTDDRAIELLSAMDYSPVFIATDVAWNIQIEALARDQLDEGAIEVLARATFTTHVLRALLGAMIQRLQLSPTARTAAHRASLSAESEVLLVESIATSWALAPAISSLLALKHSLSDRLVRIRDVIARSRRARELCLEGAEGQWIHLDCLTATSQLVELFNDATEQPDRRWALCFDELELAPKWLRLELLRSLRSTDERLIFKLALSPYVEDADAFDSAHSPSRSNDFDDIRLWFPERREGLKFCRQLWDGVVAERGFPELSAEAILGPSYFETDDDSPIPTGSAYGVGSRIQKAFASLEAKDQSFRSYLGRRGFRVEQLADVADGPNAPELRKISPLVVVRDFFRGSETGTGAVRRRSRKVRTFFAGARSLFAITEGNPRWFLAIVDRLLERLVNPTTQITASVQADEIERAAHRFHAMLSTLPSSRDALASEGDMNVADLVDRLGEWFEHRVVYEPFQPEPPATFRVDPTVAVGLERAVGRGLNAGAFVLIPERNEQAVFSSLRNHRFRVSYLLAARYGIPLRMGRHADLTTILAQPLEVQQTLNFGDPPV